jgi:CRISPR/Cas system-associated exonuclease Cas4 (RecB family)
MIYKPGYYTDLPMSEYHKSSTGISKSSLTKLMNGSPKKYRFWRDKPSPTSAALAFGTLAHQLILEPEDFYKENQVTELLRSGTKAWKAEEEESGKNLVKEKEWNELHQIRRSIENHSLGKRLIDGEGEVESTSIWEDEKTGLILKCRPDKIARKLGIVVDIKTSRDIRPQSFIRDASKLHYHLSSAMTLEGLRANAQDFNEYVFLVIEKEAPFEVAIYMNDEEAIKRGLAEMRATLELLRRHETSDYWPGIADDTILDLPLPKWYD